MKQSIKPLAENLWLVEVSGKHGGEFLRRRKRFRGSRAEAREFAGQVEFQLKNGAGPGQTTLREVFGAFMETRVVARGLAPATVKGYRVAWRIYIEPTLGDRPLCEIDAQAIEHFTAAMVREGYAYGNINRQLEQLGALVRYGWESLRLPGNPPKVRRLKAQTEYHVWRGEEIKRITAACKGSLADDPTSAAIVLLGLHAGLRVGEIVGLQVADVDLSSSRAYAHGCLTVRHSGDAESPTKGRRVRTMPLTPSLRTALRAVLKLERIGGYVLCRRWRRKLRRVREGGCRYSLGKILAVAGLSTKGKRCASMHALRHSYASQLARGGVSTLEISRLLGHSSIKITETYLHTLGTGGAVARSVAQIMESAGDVDPGPIGTGIGTPEKKCREQAASPLYLVK